MKVSSRGNPRRGFPLFSFGFYVCADTLGGGRWLALPVRPHFFGACPKKRCRAAKEKRLFLPWRLHHSRERYRSVVGTFLARLWGRGLAVVWALAFAGGERDLLWPLCEVGRPRGCHCRYQVPPTTQARFFGAPPRFFAQEQRNGVERAVGVAISAPKNGAHAQGLPFGRFAHKKTPPPGGVFSLISCRRCGRQRRRGRGRCSRGH